MTGLWQSKLGVFLLMLLLKFVNHKCLEIFTIKLIEELKLLPKLNKQFYMTLSNSLKPITFIMTIIDYINLKLKLLEFLTTYNKNKRVKTQFCLIEVHFILPQVVKFMMLELSRQDNRNMQSIMLKKQENVSYTF